MKLTEWFPGDVKPVRKGVYQRRFGDGCVVFSRWNGRAWMYAHGTIQVAFLETFPTHNTNLKWRGLAEKP